MFLVFAALMAWAATAVIDIGAVQQSLLGAVVLGLPALVLAFALSRALRWPAFRPKWRRLGTLSLATAALVSLATVSQIGANAVGQSFLTAGFHTVSFRGVASTGNMQVSCANSSDCVASGMGSYGGGVYNLRWLVAYSTDDAETWRVWALPQAVGTPLRPTCATGTCSMVVDGGGSSGSQEGLLKVSFAASGRVEMKFRQWAQRPVGSPVCVNSSCIVLTTVPANDRGARSSPDVFVWRSTDSGQTWTSERLPLPAGTPVLGGPWCTNGLRCTGDVVLIPASCVSWPSTAPGCQARMTMFSTRDGGRTWASWTLPPNGPPPPLNMSCGVNGICQGTFLGRGGWELTISGNGGRSWSRPSPDPSGLVDCWSTAGCVDYGGFRSILSTSNGGQSWQRQPISGLKGVVPLAVWCSGAGTCVATARDSMFQGLVLRRSGPTSPWTARPLPHPRPLPASLSPL